MKKFEYKIVPVEVDKKYKMLIDLEGTEALLTGEGLEGWEAVNVFSDMALSGRMVNYVLMKRIIPKQN